MWRQLTFYSLLAAVFFVAVIFPVIPAPADQGGVPHRPGEVIIKFKGNATQLEKQLLRTEMKATKRKNFSRIQAELSDLDPSISVDECIARYQNHPKIEYIEPNYIWQAEEIPDDPMFDQLWGMHNTGQTGGTPGADISATNAWDVFTGSDQAIIGVIDTGVDYLHPDLAANIWTNPGEIPDNGIDDDNNGYIDDVRGWDFINDDNDPMDDNGHGTHVSGTIGAVGNNGIGVAGVNWNVKIVPLKFLSAGGSGSTDDAVAAVEYATSIGVHLTSNSWGGGGFSQALLDAIDEADANGILFAAAAGNSGSDNDVSPHYPSNYDSPNIIAVAATDHNDELAGFSSFGATTVDLAAPGVDILSTLPGNNYGGNSGTSMATPHVAGVAGMVFGRFPAIGHLDAKNLILNFADPLPNLDGLMVTGGRLNAFLPIADPDSTAPGMIDDLAITTPGSNWMILGWSATGDDGETGTASRYEVRYSMSPIDELNFDAAALAPNPPDPGPVGTPEALQVGGLDFSTLYYFAAKAFDEFGNAGPVSNIASATTLGIPDIAVAPLSLSETLLTGATSTQGLTLSNVAFGTLDFEIPFPEVSGEPVVQAAYEEIAKGAFDPREGNPVIAGLGGPDAFGYRWVDSDESFGPLFNWQDISGTGTVAISSGDDTNSGPFPIGFTFSFYGADYDEFRVCSNGWLSFTSTSTAFSNQPLPNAGAPDAMIAPFWDDLVVGAGNVYYQSDGSQLIVQWDAVDHYGSGGPYTFQAILSSNGVITYQYLSIGAPDNSATVGIQNPGGADGMEVAFNTAYVHDNLAVKIQAVPQWVDVSPTSGTVFAPGSTPLTVDFDAADLVGGTYEGTIRILSNDPDESPYEVPVTLTVIGAPDIAVTPGSYDFGDVFLGATPTTTIVVQNPGTEVLNVSGIAFDDPALSSDITSFAVPARGSQAVVVTYAPTVASLLSATMTITSDDPDQPTALVSLSGAGLVPPDFSVTPASLSADLLTGETETQALTVTNTGGADLEYTIGVDLGAQVVQYEGLDLAKGEEDPGPGILGTGGPDTFGYSWTDSDEPGGPVFDWVDISGVGTPTFTGNSDDGNRGPFPIGFDFSFYGNTFSEFRVCSNGFVSFTSTSGDFSNGPLPGTGAPENLLAAYHDDMYVDQDIPSQIYYYNDGSRLIVQFDNIRRLGQSDTSPPFYTFQAIIYPNGTILYQYLTVGVTNNSATVGIQNDARDDGLTVTYNTAYVHDNMAIRFSATPEYLSASPLAGTIPPGGSELIDVTFNAEGLFGGLYQGDININTNDPLAPLVTIPATLNVTGAPDIDVSAAAVDFGQVFVGYPGVESISVTNVGTDVLTITDLTIDNPEFLVSFTDVTLPLVLDPLASALIGLRFAPTVAGPATGTLSIVSDDSDEGTVPVALSGEGLIPPLAGVAPDTLYSALFTGETESQTVTLSNTGGSDLTYEVRALASLGVEETITQVLDHELEKDEVDPRFGVLGAGGPDAFGYSWTDSDEPNGPVFNWIDISATGTAVYASTADDSNQGPFPIGFNFSFYGNTFDTFRVSSNGFVSFTSTLTDFSNDPIPAAFGPENLLAVFWDDMVVDLSIGGQVYYESDGTRLIVQYDGIRRFGQSSGPYYTFQVQIFPNGSIIYQYLTLGTLTTSATVGIQNDTKDVGLNVVYNSAYLHENLAVRLATSPEWLSASPTTGTIPPGGSQDISVLFNAVDLFGGTYEGALEILNNDPLNGFLRVGARLDVTGVPDIAFGAASVDFGDIYIGYPDTLFLTVTNIGTDLLSVNSVVPGLPEYTVSPVSFDLDPLESENLTVVFDPVTEGMHNTDLIFTSNDPDSPHTVALTGTGLIPPVATLSPDPVVGAAMPGGSKTKPLTLCNEGGSDMTYQVSWSEQTGTAVQTHGYVELPKGEDVPDAVIPEDTRPGILGNGGPDAFGYTWIDSDDPAGPAYDWVDITGIGTPVGFAGYSDDGNVGPNPIGFDFPFYGNSFSEFNVCSNGWVSFTSTQTTYTNQPLPNDAFSVPENLLAVYWDDMVHDPSDSNEVLFYNDGSRLIIQYFVRRIGDFTPPYYKFQVILYPDGGIVYQYHTLDSNTTSATIGIQNATKDDGLTVVFNDTYVHEELAILFSSAPGWLSVAPESGVLAAGECIDLMVHMDAAALDAGDYYGEVSVATNDPANPVVSSDVVFHVGTVDAAYTDVDPNTLNLDSNGKWIKGSVELPAPYTPEQILVETVLLNGVVPADPTKVTIGDFNMNGIPDISFKFDRSEVEAILDEGDSVEVCITGEIEDIIYFVAKDVIRVIRPVMHAPNGGETIIVDSIVPIVWSSPDGWNVDSATLVYSIDGGETWTVIAEGISGESYDWTVPIEFTTEGLIRVYAIDGAGVMGYDTSDGPFTMEGATLGTNPVLPTVHALHQNNPNPFNRATQITFDIPEDAKVRLTIFDVSGRVVRTLEEGALPRGTYQRGWDGRDHSGKSVASGIYFYRLETGDFTKTKRMFLMN